MTLGHMELAPPNPDKIAGATWGNTRKGGIEFHHGTDLSGDVGSPVCAQFDGTIGKIVWQQPNRIGGNYPDGYSDDNNDAGNRIYVNSIVDGNTVNNGYWHLQAGNAIANNPRTGQPFTTGDTVYAGEVIGYIGYTGNANVNVPHVHVNTYKNWIEINPELYFNATIDPTTTTITTPCD